MTIGSKGKLSAIAIKIYKLSIAVAWISRNLLYSQYTVLSIKDF